MSALWQLHPIFSSFPFVGFLIALLLEIGRIVLPRRVSGSMVGVGVIVGVLGSIAAYFSGTSAAASASQTFTVADSAIAWHNTWGRMVLFVALPTGGLFWISEKAQYYRTAFTWAFRVMLVASLALCIVTGHLGGELVFEHGAGVRVEQR